MAMLLDFSQNLSGETQESSIYACTFWELFSHASNSDSSFNYPYELINGRNGA